MIDSSHISNPPQATGFLDPSMTLLAYYEKYFRPRRLRGRAESSDRQYRINLRHYDRFLRRPATLADLDDDMVSEFIASILDRGKSPATANKARNHILSLWRFAARKRHVDLFPDVDRLKEFRRHPSAWSLEQSGRMLAAAGTTKHDQPIAGIPADLWWHTLFLTLFFTGIRIGAALKLKCSDYDEQTKRLTVPAEIQKQAADQVFTLKDELAGFVTQCIAESRRELLFPWPFHRSSLYNRLSHILKLAGLPATRRDKFHRIRRTSGTMAELHVGRGTAYFHLGHSSPKVTESYIDRSMLPENNVAASLPMPVDTAPTGQDVELVGLIAEYRHVRDDVSNEHAENIELWLFRIVDWCGFKVVGDLDGAKIVATGMERIQNGRMSPATITDHVMAFRLFVGWIATHKRIAGAVLACLTALANRSRLAAEFEAARPPERPSEGPGATVTERDATAGLSNGRSTSPPKQPRQPYKRESRLAPLVSGLLKQMPTGRHSYDVALEVTGGNHEFARRMLAYLRREVHRYPALKELLDAEPPRTVQFVRTERTAEILARSTLDRDGLREVVGELRAQGVLQRELAELIGISAIHLDHMLGGSRYIMPRVLEGLRKVFG